MKKLIYALLICFLLPAISQAAYLIKLKNKGSYTVYQYWEEGNTVVFTAYGGKIAIPKDKIESIADLDENSEAAKDILPETAPEPEEVAAEPAPPKEQEQDVSKESTAPAPTAKPDKDALNPEAVEYMNRKESLVKWLQKAQSALKREKEMGKEEAWIENREKKIAEIKARIDELAREVAEKNSGVLPPWWYATPIPEE